MDVAVEGTQNVMMSAAKAVPSGLQRIILTSSCAAVKGMKPAPPKCSNGLYNEEDWNETSTVEGGEAYWVGKTKAEKLAWAIAREHGLDLVTILPEFVMGPLLSSRSDSTSIKYFKKWLEGGVHIGAPVFVDVRDVATAHVLAAENAAARGRYIVANPATTPSQEILEVLKGRFPEFQFGESETQEESTQVVNPSKAIGELGLRITPVQSTLIDMAVTMIVLGVAQPRRKHE